MTDFMKMDVFFFIASIGLILITALLTIALYYAIRILRHLKNIAEEAEEETKRLRTDFAEARIGAKTEGKKLLALAGVFRRSIKRLLSRK